LKYSEPESILNEFPSGKKKIKIHPNFANSRVGGWNELLFL
jgi:hypothetical protein